MACAWFLGASHNLQKKNAIQETKCHQSVWVLFWTIVIYILRKIRFTIIYNLLYAAISSRIYQYNKFACFNMGLSLVSEIYIWKYFIEILRYRVHAQYYNMYSNWIVLHSDIIDGHILLVYIYNNSSHLFICFIIIVIFV